MKKASVNWPAPDYSCPKPRAKFPAVTLGGLPPPTFAKRSLTPVVLPSGSPCQPPPPRPLPLSLRPQEPAPAKVGCSTAPVVTSSQQRSLVLPTSLPPDICRESRGAFTTSLQHWHTAKQVYERWLGELICSIGPSSWICREFSQQKTFPTVIRQLLSHIGPSTLDLYSRSIATMQNWMQHLGVDWDELNLQILIEILHHAKDAAKNDVQANRLQPQYLLRGLRWLAKTALVEHLDPLLNNSLVSSFLKGSGAPKDRREAVPIPLLILILWEEALKKSSTPTWIRLLLGGFLLATWGSLRFADLQRIELSSLNVADNCLRGTCRMTKTTRSGQPFAVLLAGFSADSAQSSWVFHWLRTLHQAAARHPQFAPDFIIPTMDSLHCPSLTAPLSYAAALRAIRWACQTPWDHPRMSSQSAQNITLHSLKVTMLSSAAQLRLPHRDRQIQGHHTGGSVQLYSRDDTVDALWVQTQISTSVRQGWRPVRPQHRGGQAPMHEMPVTLALPEFPLLIQLPQLDDLSRFQAPCPAALLVDIVLEDNSSSDSSSEESVSSTSSATLERPSEPTANFFVQNGPAGCCHALIQAPANTPDNRLFTIDDASWTTRCGATLRKSAKPVEALEILWPCKRQACRVIFDSLLSTPDI